MVSESRVDASALEDDTVVAADALWKESYDDGAVVCASWKAGWHPENEGCLFGKRIVALSMVAYHLMMVMMSPL